MPFKKQTHTSNLVQPLLILANKNKEIGSGGNPLYTKGLSPQPEQASFSNSAFWVSPQKVTLVFISSTKETCPPSLPKEVATLKNDSHSFAESGQPHSILKKCSSLLQ